MEAFSLCTRSCRYARTGPCRISSTYQLIVRGDEKKPSFEVSRHVASETLRLKKKLIEKEKEKERKKEREMEWKKGKTVCWRCKQGRIYDDHSNVTPEGTRECTLGLECYRDSYWITLGAVLIGLVLALMTIQRNRRLAVQAGNVRHAAGPWKSDTHEFIFGRFWGIYKCLHVSLRSHIMAIGSRWYRNLFFFI